MKKQSANGAAKKLPKRKTTEKPRKSRTRGKVQDKKTIVGRQRPVEMKMRVSEEEAGFIRKKMDQVGIRNREAYLRKMAIDGYCISLDLTTIRDYTRQLSAVGNNLNQMAKVANSTGKIYAKEIADLQMQFEKLAADSEKILRSLAFQQDGRRYWKEG